MQTKLVERFNFQWQFIANILENKRKQSLIVCNTISMLYFEQMRMSLQN
jgi:glutamate racemase